MKPLSSRCHMRAQWTIPVVCLHSLYIDTLVGVTAAVHHIEFRFDELKDLWQGILVSAVSIDATMEVNISYRSRQEILSTSNLACSDLFHNSLDEIIQLMRTNLARDYWSLMFFLKSQEDSNARSNEYELEQMTGWNFSPRLSSVHDTDDPFHQDHLLKSSGCSNDTADL